MALKPEDGDFYAWERFIAWCEDTGVDTSADDTEADDGDWQAWWECWQHGYIAAIQ